MYGPPGTGKTCALKILTNDVVAAGGIAVKWPTSADMFTGAMRLLRKLQPDIPVVVLMEDLDAILENENKSKVLNILDGVEAIENIVYLATTNHPEDFDSNIVDRPSRFDKRFHIGYPNAEIREAYLRHLFGDDADKVDLRPWIKKTKSFSIAHLKELFIAVVILGNPFEDSVKRLRKMAEDIEPDEERSDALERSNLGFAHAK
jgi:SpoVK/Ycf46/Vps4 family AAA+-type ATPase